MADVAECIANLVTAGKITKAIGDEGLEMYKRNKAEYTTTLGPAGSRLLREGGSTPATEDFA